MKSKGKDLITNFLEEKGVKEVFSVPGVHSIPLAESLLSRGIKIINARCERSLIFMADGYARASKKTAIVVLTPGPGLCNSVLGCFEAFSSQVPILLIHMDTDRVEKEIGVLHELKEPERIFEGITKKIIRVTEPVKLFSSLENAFKETKRGRWGPVLVSIPFVLLEKDIKCDFQEEETEEKGEGPGEFCSKFKELMKEKKRPLIIAGSNVMIEAAKETFDRICMEGRIPLLTTTGGKGVVDERKPYAFGNVMQRGLVRRMLEEADIVIAVGTRLRDQDTKRRGIKFRNLVQLDVDGAWFNKNFKAALTFIGEPETLLDVLSEVLSGIKSDWRIDELKKTYREEIEKKRENLGFRVIETIRKAIPPETITVWDLSMLSYWAEYCFPVYEQRTFLISRGSSTIFYGLPAAIGAKLAVPERPCLSVSGDGGILPSIAELSTLTKYRVPVIVLIYNNLSFGILERMMEKRYGFKGSMDLENPDFLKIAEAFGLKGARAKTEEEILNILRKVNWDEPLVIEVSMPGFALPWEF
ncbi:MAG: thiamine pyrophosphate-binding protein [Deltaproteobacteria bacterium]|nr:thiamine pyrophosphate-binding protein [Deltaproteobacteria bacterium]